MPSPSTSKSRFWSWLIVGLCLIYTIGLLTFFILRAIMNPWPPFLALVNNFVPLLFIPLPVTLSLAWLVKSRLALFSQLIVFSFFMMLYGLFFLPRLHPLTPPSGEPLTAMTFNLGAYRSPPEILAATIEAEEADIVAIQELTPAASKFLKERLSRRYPHHLMGIDIGSTGLLSRYPILSYHWFQPLRHGRSGLHATLDFKGKPLHVIVIHLYSPGISWYRSSILLPTGLYYEDQTYEIAEIMTYIVELKEPILLLGDFNMSDQNRAYAQLTGAVHDAHREAGWGFGFTFPNQVQMGDIPLPTPLVRIDYIFHSDQIYAEHSHVGCAGGSDHCYVVARLRY
jgi:vancomycin resistance protein VanJ